MGRQDHISHRFLLNPERWFYHVVANLLPVFPDCGPATTNQRTGFGIELQDTRRNAAVQEGKPLFLIVFSRKEASELRQAFWTAFGQYMLPVAPADGERVNWVNYKTGEKDITFRMETGNRAAQVGIVLTHKDAGLRQLYYEQFVELRALLESHTGEEWNWQPEYYDEYGAVSSRMYTEKEDLLVLRRSDWPELISFFKPRIIALDAFWSEARYFFEALRG